MGERLQDDEQFWLALDNFVNSAWLPYKLLNEVILEHESELDITISALVLGGLGNFVRSYAIMRSEGLSPQESFSIALTSVQSDHRVQTMLQVGANRLVDSKVEQIKEK